MLHWPYRWTLMCKRLINWHLVFCILWIWWLAALFANCQLGPALSWTLARIQCFWMTKLLPKFQFLVKVSRCWLVSLKLDVGGFYFIFFQVIVCRQGDGKASRIIGMSLLWLPQQGVRSPTRQYVLYSLNPKSHLYPFPLFHSRVMLFVRKWKRVRIKDCTICIPLAKVNNVSQFYCQMTKT